MHHRALLCLCCSSAKRAARRGQLHSRFEPLLGVLLSTHYFSHSRSLLQIPEQGLIGGQHDEAISKTTSDELSSACEEELKDLMSIKHEEARDVFINDLSATLDAHRATNRASRVRKLDQKADWKPPIFKNPLVDAQTAKGDGPENAAAAPGADQDVEVIREALGATKGNEESDLGVTKTRKDRDAQHTGEGFASLKPRDKKQRYYMAASNWPADSIQNQRFRSARRRGESAGVMEYEAAYILPKDEFFMSNKRFDCPWIVGVGTYYSAKQRGSALQRLCNEIKAYESFMQCSPIEEEAARLLTDEVNSIVHQTHPDNPLIPIGSHSTGLADRWSDFDFSISFPELEKSPLERGPSSTRPLARKIGEKALMDIKKSMAKSRRYIDPVELIRARVPIVKAVHGDTNLRVELQALGSHQATREYSMAYLAEFPTLRPLYIIFRSALHIRHLNKVHEGGLGSYSVLMMIVNALKHASTRYARDDLANHFLHVLDFYGNADLYKYGFSPDPPRIFKKVDGKRSADEKIARLQDPMLRGIDIMQKLDTKKPYLLCLQDPANPVNDLGCKAYGIKHIQMLFRSIRHGLRINMKAWEGSGEFEKEWHRRGLLAQFLASNYSMLEKKRLNIRTWVEKKKQKSQHDSSIADLSARAHHQPPKISPRTENKAASMRLSQDQQDDIFIEDSSNNQPGITAGHVPEKKNKIVNSVALVDHILPTPEKVAVPSVDQAPVQQKYADQSHASSTHLDSGSATLKGNLLQEVSADKEAETLSESEGVQASSWKRWSSGSEHAWKKWTSPSELTLQLEVGTQKPRTETDQSMKDSSTKHASMVNRGAETVNSQAPNKQSPKAKLIGPQGEMDTPPLWLSKALQPPPDPRMWQTFPEMLKDITTAISFPEAIKDMKWPELATFDERCLEHFYTHRNAKSEKVVALMVVHYVRSALWQYKPEALTPKLHDAFRSGSEHLSVARSERFREAVRHLAKDQPLANEEASSTKQKSIIKVHERKCREQAGVKFYAALDVLPLTPAARASLLEEIEPADRTLGPDEYLKLAPREHESPGPFSSLRGFRRFQIVKWKKADRDHDEADNDVEINNGDKKSNAGYLNRRSRLILEAIKELESRAAEVNSPTLEATKALEPIAAEVTSPTLEATKELESRAAETTSPYQSRRRRLRQQRERTSVSRSPNSVPMPNNRGMRKVGEVAAGENVFRVYRSDKGSLSSSRLNADYPENLTWNSSLTQIEELQSGNERGVAPRFWLRHRILDKLKMERGWGQYRDPNTPIEVFEERHNPEVSRPSLDDPRTKDPSSDDQSSDQELRGTRKYFHKKRNSVLKQPRSPQLDKKTENSWKKMSRQDKDLHHGRRGRRGRSRRRKGTYKLLTPKSRKKFNRLEKTRAIGERFKLLREKYKQEKMKRAQIGDEGNLAHQITKEIRGSVKWIEQE